MLANLLRLTLFVLLFSSPNVSDAKSLEPGLYEIQVDVSTAAKSETQTRCITETEIERNDPFNVFTAFPKTNCLKLPVYFGKGKGGFDIVCVDGRPHKANARFLFSDDWFKGTIRLIQIDGDRIVNTVEKQYGFRIGDCVGSYGSPPANSVYAKAPRRVKHSIQRLSRFDSRFFG